MIKRKQLPVVFLCPTSPPQKKPKVIDQKILQTSRDFCLNDFSWDFFFTDSKKKQNISHSKCLQKYLPKFPCTVSLKRRPKLQNANTVTTLKILLAGLRNRHGKHLIRTALETCYGLLGGYQSCFRKVFGMERVPFLLPVLMEELTKKEFVRSIGKCFGILIVLGHFGAGVHH